MKLIDALLTLILSPLIFVLGMCLLCIAYITFGMLAEASSELIELAKKRYAAIAARVRELFR